MPGPAPVPSQRGRRARRVPTRRERRLALALTASALAASALVGCDSPPTRGVAGRAPDCPPPTTSPYEVTWDDPNGCWESRPDGQRLYRTTWGGHYYYNPSPPYYSRYYEPETSVRGSRWFSSTSHAGSGYHGAPSGAG